MEEEESSSGEGPTPDYPDYSTNTADLWISISSVTNAVVEGTTNLQAALVVHNTSNAVPYEILSALSLTNAMSNWVSEGVWIGLPGTNTPASVAVGTRTNQNFFRAKVFNGFSN